MIPINKKIKGKVEKFKSDAVTGLSFRKDGKLMAVGEADGKISIVETKKRALLRTFKHHKQATHALRFIGNSSYLATGSDDLTVKLYDISTRSIVRDFIGLHDDYIRSIRVLNENQNLLLVGSYDKKVSLLDLRILEQKAVQTFEHQFPVEDMDVFSDNNRFVTAAGTTVAIWDVRQNQIIGSSVNNLKTVTTCRVTSNDTRIITGSLDQQLKVLDVENFAVQYQTKLQAGIMSFDITKNQTYWAVGMNNGDVEIRCRRTTEEEGKVIDEEDRNDIALPQLEGKSKKVIRNYKYFYRGIYERPTDFDVKVETERKRRLQDFDKFLKKFQYKKALTSSLKIRNAHVTIGLIEELVQREALDIALRNSTDEELDSVFEFLAYNLADSRYTVSLVPFAEKLLELYASQVIQDATTREKFEELSEFLEEIIQEKDLMMNLLGKLEMILDSNILQGETN